MPCTLSELATLVENTRQAQKARERADTSAARNIARDWERRLDEAAASALRPPQAGLFAAEAKGGS